jgi:hypothetical protein
MAGCLKQLDHENGLQILLSWYVTDDTMPSGLHSIVAYLLRQVQVFISALCFLNQTSIYSTLDNSLSWNGTFEALKYHSFIGREKNV